MTDEKLLSEVKAYIDITWDDKATNKKVDGIIARGKRLIARHAAKRHIDFEQDSEERDLLFDYCRLAWAGVPEEFEKIYKSDLIGLRLENVTKEKYGNEEKIHPCDGHVQ